MPISVGDAIPAVKVMQATAEGPKEVDTGEFFKGRTVALFGVPGAFTPTCSAKHLPGYVERAGELKAKGVDMVACVSVNDAFVMAAWARDQKAFGKVTMIADGNADFAKALGVELDLVGANMGIRNQRYAAVIDNNVVTAFALEAPGKFEVSSAEAVIAKL